MICIMNYLLQLFFFFFFQAEDGIRDYKVTGVQTCALPIYYELRHAEQTETVLDRALAIAKSEPQGPVYVTLPREVLASTFSKELSSTASIEIGRASCRERV